MEQHRTVDMLKTNGPYINICRIIKTKCGTIKIEQFQVLVDKNLYQSNFKYFTVIFTFS